MRVKKQPWHRGPVSWVDGNDMYISVVFTWQIHDVRSLASWGKCALRHRVHIGGPATHVMKKELRDYADVLGGDMPDAVTRHNPDATFASRGCPVGCWFCIVPSMEGREFTLIDDFVPRPIPVSYTHLTLPTILLV